MAEELEKYVKQLEDNIWITRKCRINAAERLQANENFCRFISIYYSIMTTGYTLINMLVLEDKIVDVVTLIIAIATTSFFFYLDTKNYKDRYLGFKENYIKLGKLLDKIKEKRIVGFKIEDYHEISEEYAELQMSVENHKTKDYNKLLLEQNVENKKLKFKEKVLYYGAEWLFFFLKCIAFLFPIVCGIVYWLIKMK